MRDVQQVGGEVQVEQGGDAELAVNLFDPVLRDDALLESERQVGETRDSVLRELERLEVGEGEQVSVDFCDSGRSEVEVCVLLFDEVDVHGGVSVVSELHDLVLDLPVVGRPGQGVVHVEVVLLGVQLVRLDDDALDDRLGADLRAAHV